MNKSEIKAIVNSARGSTLTKEARSANLSATAKDLKLSINIQIKSFGDLKTQHLAKLVDFWKSEGKSTRTIQNRLAHMRVALRVLDRQKFADSAQNSNASLGASGGSRGGTHTVPTKEVITEKIGNLPPGCKEAAQLQLTLGLRAQEAIQSNQSLRLWEKQLERGDRVTVLHGTKGGRARDVFLTSEKAAQDALEAVRAAIAVMDEQDGLLVASRSLEGANRSYQRAMNDAGFKGSQASHSLRYQFARAQFRGYLDRGFDRKEALSALSMDLGHGDGRGRYCAQVYLRGMES